MGRILYNLRNSAIGEKLLAQILPGFRDFRTPLVIGSLWLVFIWIWLGMPVPSKEETEGPVGLLNALGEYLTPTSFIGVLSFVAYVIGIVLALDSKLATRVHGVFNRRARQRSFDFRTQQELDKRLPIFLDGAGGTSRRATPQLYQLVAAAAMRARDRDADWREIYRKFGGSTAVDTAYGELWKERGEDYNAAKHAEMIEKAFDHVRPQIMHSIEQELPVLGNKLLHTNKDLYEVYDRTTSEADFRLGIAPPIFALTVQQAIVLGPESLGLTILVSSIGLLLGVTLIVKGWNKVQESTSTVLSMVQIGAIESPTIQRLDSVRS